MRFFFGELLGDLGHILFMQGFGNQNNLMRAPGLNRIVQGANVINAETLEPVAILAKCGKQFGIITHRLKLRGRVPARKAKRETAIGGIQVKPFKVSGRRHHVPVMVVHVTAEAI